jgi:phosphate transport system protein
MVVRENFQTQINDLKDSLIDLGRMSEEALKQSLQALKEQDVEKALHIIDTDHKINELEEEINDRAILMIAKQQPVASDLRRIMVAIKISTDVERMGDLAVNIAKSTIRIGKAELIKPLEDIPHMAGIAFGMLSNALKAYYEEDVVLAKNLAETDDKVDEMYGYLVQELLKKMSQKPETIEQVIQLSYICRYIERVADHATNIAESVIYIVKGKRYDLND